MPPNLTFPGVYIEEIPSGVRTIRGVATSIAAFIDRFPRGLLNHPVQIFNPGDFEREFGGLDPLSEASYGIYQFFLNGGTEAWVVRVAGPNTGTADVQILSAINGATALTIQAGRVDDPNPGEWGNNLRVRIDPLESGAPDVFNMTVFLIETRRNQEVVVVSETFRNLVMDSTSPRFVQRVINDEFSGSKLVRVTASGNTRPLLNGTLSGILPPSLAITSTTPEVEVTIGTDGQGTATLSAVPTTQEEARRFLESAIRAARPELRAFSQATVSIVDNRLRILAGPTTSNARVTFSPGGTDPTVTTLGLTPGTTLDGVLSDDVSGAFSHGGGNLQVTIGGSGPILLTLGAMVDLAAARSELESRIQAAATDPAVQQVDVTAFEEARVVAHSDAGIDRLIVLAGLPGVNVGFTQDGTDITVTDLGLDGGTATVISALVSNDLTPVPSVPAGSAVNVTIGGIGPHTGTTGAVANTLAGIATELQGAIRGADTATAFTETRVAAYDAGENRLVVLPGVVNNTVVFTASPADTTTVLELFLDTAEANVQAYALGGDPASLNTVHSAITDTAQGPGTIGNNGDPPAAADLIGDLANKTGIHALEDVDLFNILCLPRASQLDETQEVLTVMTHANNYCEQRRAFFIVDIPSGIDEVQEAKTWLQNSGLQGRRNAALYFPRVLIPDPLDEFRLRSFGASGTVAGLYARTDSNRGVWKAPAGTEATLTNVQGYEYVLTDQENGTLNQRGINCLRQFPVFGRVSWGARTLDGDDQIGSEWQYIPVRRLALFLEESLYRGTQWVVFEPNDEPLWAQIRLNIGAFMQNLFRQGAFQGKTPREAYLVKCDRETTTQNDINQGIVNILVGFAPLKPAEFVVIKIQQLAGQIQT